MVAVEEGVSRVDASLFGHVAGAGNCPIEAFVAVADIYGWDSVATYLPYKTPPKIWSARCRTDRCASTGETLTLGYAGVYSSFLRHAERAAQHHSLNVRNILIEVGRRGLVGGQEDMITDVALNLVGAAAARRDDSY